MADGVGDDGARPLDDELDLQAEVPADEHRHDAPDRAGPEAAQPRPDGDGNRVEVDHRRVERGLPPDQCVLEPGVCARDVGGRDDDSLVEVDDRSEVARDEQREHRDGQAQDGRCDDTAQQPRPHRPREASEPHRTPRSRPSRRCGRHASYRTSFGRNTISALGPISGVAGWDVARWIKRGGAAQVERGVMANRSQTAHRGATRAAKRRPRESSSSPGASAPRLRRRDPR